MTVEVLRVDDAAGLARVRGVRFEVFVGEFAITADEEHDELDEAPGVVHVLAVDGPEDLGTARLVSDAAHPGIVHMTRVAVRATARGRGVGRAVMEALEQIAWAEHAVGDPPAVRLELSAMETAVPFYRSLGYDIGEERYLEVRIPHRAATKVLTDPPRVGSGRMRR
jgi:predicted GNAT family N-acyltransferase